VLQTSPSINHKCEVSLISVKQFSIVAEKIKVKNKNGHQEALLWSNGFGSQLALDPYLTDHLFEVWLNSVKQI
jgi:hypothetical protein